MGAMCFVKVTSAGGWIDCAVGALGARKVTTSGTIAAPGSAENRKLARIMFSFRATPAA
jgi:hypothetical protein